VVEGLFTLGEDGYVPQPERSILMSRVRRAHTAPELLVRQAAHRLGYRFRLHRKDLPGTPDIVFRGRRKIIFVHGCFWHRHAGCKYASTPKSRREFWEQKFDQNIARDKRIKTALDELGWKTLIIWECETRDQDQLETLLRRHLG
jgi:DNA mismatch endonuclease (patch repair protein)